MGSVWGVHNEDRPGQGAGCTVLGCRKAAECGRDTGHRHALLGCGWDAGCKHAMPGHRQDVCQDRIMLCRAVVSLCPGQEHRNLSAPAWVKKQLVTCDIKMRTRRVRVPGAEPLFLPKLTHPHRVWEKWNSVPFLSFSLAEGPSGGCFSVKHR